MQQQAYRQMYEMEDRHWWFVARREIIRKVLDQLFPDHDATAVLEAGCGTGGNLQMLSAYGPLQAFEPDAEARAMANSRGICQVESGDLPAAIPFPGQYQLICMLDVLEHIDDDEAALEQIARRLAPGGKLLLTVPAYPFLWSGHDVALNHKRRYTRKVLLERICRAGLKPVYTGYFNTLLLPLIMLARLAGKLFTNNINTDLAMPPVWVNTILTRILASERLLVPLISLPAGVSILLVAEVINPVHPD